MYLRNEEQMECISAMYSEILLFVSSLDFGHVTVNILYACSINQELNFIKANIFLL